MKRKKVTMVGNSHIDPVWLWRDREGYQAVRSTFASALERMKEFPEFEYTASSTAFDVWLEQHCPEMLRDIRARVAEGRWHLAGGWWVEPDCNIPGGESLVRQGLYGQRELKRIFGTTATVGYNVDSFGHQAGTPSILAGQGMKGYVFMRPNSEQMTLPAPAFRWVGEDGKMVIGERCEGEYCAWTRTAIIENLDKTLAAMDEKGLEHLPAYYGVGNHGGGPTIENIKAIRELQLEREEIELVNGGPEDYFDHADPSMLPEVTGDLEHVFLGCYTVDAELKRLCRETEEALVKAEILTVMAGCEDAAWLKLTESWKLLLFCQFHDTLAGTARKESRDDAVMDLHRALSVAREVAGSCMQLISNRFDTRGDGFPLLVLNPTDQDYEGIIEADVEWRSKFPMRLKDSAGIEQVYDASVIMLTAPDVRKHFVFRGRVPAFGAAVFRLMPEGPTVHAQPMNCPENTLENDYLRAVIDPESGALVSLFDKVHDCELLSGPALLRVYEDARDTWGSNGGIGAYRGDYKADKVYQEENGALRTTITCRMSHGRSEALLRWTLNKDDHFISLDAQVDSREKLAMTVMHLPLLQEYQQAIVEGAYAEVVRSYPEEGERNMQRYLDLTCEKANLLVLNKAKFGYRAHEGALEILLMRGSVHAFGAGEKIRDDREYDYADQGLDHFVLRLEAHDGLTRAERVRRAQLLHRPMEALLIEQHDGAEPRRELSMFRLENCPDCVVAAVKRAEDGGIAVRIQSCSEESQKGTLVLRGQRYEVTLPPLALTTVVIHGENDIVVTNLVELVE